MTGKRYEVIVFDNGQYGLKDNKDPTGKHDLVIESNITEAQAKEFCKKLNRMESYFEHKEKQNSNIVEMLRRDI